MTPAFCLVPILLAKPSKPVSIDPATRHAIEVQYWRQARAYERGNLAVLDEILARDFVVVLDRRHQVNRAQALQMARRTMDLYGRELKMTYRIDRMIPSADGVEVQVSNSLNGTIMSPQGKSQRLESSDVSRELWIHSGKTWKLKVSQLLRSSTLVNGRPVAS